MALQKQHEINNTGITGDYFRVQSRRFDVDGKIIEFVLFLYKDKTARENGKKYIGRWHIDLYLDDATWNTYFDWSVLNQQDNNIVSQTYKLLKAKSGSSNNYPVDLTSATDV